MTDDRPYLFLDASQGAAGDMLLAALIDLGADVDAIRARLGSLPFDGWTLECLPITRCGIAARRIEVQVGRQDSQRDWQSIRGILEGGDLSESVRTAALATFRRLFEAEARVHGGTAETVHLHEAGAVDAILDIVGTLIALELLQVGRVLASTMTTGFGEVRCAHGLYPVPAPATLELVRGFPVRAGSIEAERLTPTGAALLTTCVDEWTEMPAMRPRSIGYGAGNRDLGSCPNMLRAILGQAAGNPARAGEGSVDVIECNLDDMTPQALGHATQRLLESGALDVFVSPVVMKKGRPGHLLSVLAPAGRVDELVDRVLQETSSLGCRVRTERRVELDRRFVTVETRFGPIEVKIGTRNGTVIQAWPEFEDCAAAARAHRVALDQVQQAALAGYRMTHDATDCSRSKE